MLPLNEHTIPERRALKLIMIGDFGAALARIYIFGFLNGSMHLVSMWIDYIGFATMNFCQVMVVAFCGGVEALMLFMNMRDGGTFEALIRKSDTTLTVFWIAFMFACVKCYSSFEIQRKFKIIHLALNGNSQGPTGAFQFTN